MDLREPKRKRKPNISLQSPFPVPIEGVTGIPTSCAAWKICSGKYNGDCVIVNNSDEISKLYYQGFFGKGSLSHSFPEHGKIIRGIPPFIRQRQWESHRSWAGLESPEGRTVGDNDEVSGDTCQTATDTGRLSNTSTESSKEVNDSEKCTDENNLHGDKGVIPCKNQSDTCATEKKSLKKVSSENDVNASELPNSKQLSASPSTEQEETMVLVVPDSDEDDVDVQNFIANLKPKLDSDPFPLHEALHLTLEEAFFLSYALGCLKVADLHGNNLSLTNMWQLFCDSQKDFIQSYVVYHYYRSKNWVVKNGLIFGGDFVLYKQGPPFYHASYIVKIEVVGGLSREKVQPAGRALGWAQLMGLHRLAETAAKEIILCQVVSPAELEENELRSPTVLSKFTVHEILVRRWVTSKEREKELDDL